MYIVILIFLSISLNAFVDIESNATLYDIEEESLQDVWDRGVASINKKQLSKELHENMQKLWVSNVKLDKCSNYDILESNLTSKMPEDIYDIAGTKLYSKNEIINIKMKQGVTSKICILDARLNKDALVKLYNLFEDEVKGCLYYVADADSKKVASIIKEKVYPLPQYLADDLKISCSPSYLNIHDNIVEQYNISIEDMLK